MENNEYINALEARIEALEQQLQNITVALGKSATFENCTISAIALEKCKDVNIKNSTVQALNLDRGTCKAVKNTIHNLDSGKAKTKILKCTIQNLDNK